MSPPDPMDIAKDRGLVSVLNKSTGEIFFCKMNPETETYEVIASSPPAVNVINLQAKFSKICTKSFKVIVYAVDTENDKLGKYIFEENDFKPAPDCHCDGCKLNVHEIGDNTSIFYTNGNPLILLDIQWIGCRIKGKCSTFLDPATGIIGAFESAEFKELPGMSRLLPDEEAMEPLDHHLISTRYCPHIEQNIYICARGNEQLYLTFNRRHGRFEIIDCGCEFNDLVVTVYAQEKLVDHFACTQHGIYVGVYCTLEGKLKWKTYSKSHNVWEDGSGYVYDYRDLLPNELLLRYNFTQNTDLEPFINVLDPDHCHRLLFTESSPFGDVYWMVDNKYELLPYRYSSSESSLGSQLYLLDQLELFENRFSTADALAGKKINKALRGFMIQLFNNHRCEECKGNQKCLYEKPEDQMSGNARARHLRNAALISLETRSLSPPNFAAPSPPPPPMDEFTKRLQESMVRWEKLTQEIGSAMPKTEQSKGYLPSHMVAKLRPTSQTTTQPTAPQPPPPQSMATSQPVKPLYTSYTPSNNPYLSSPYVYSGMDNIGMQSYTSLQYPTYPVPSSSSTSYSTGLSNPFYGSSTGYTGYGTGLEQYLGMTGGQTGRQGYGQVGGQGSLGGQAYGQVALPVYPQGSSVFTTTQEAPNPAPSTTRAPYTPTVNDNTKKCKHTTGHNDRCPLTRTVQYATMNPIPTPPPVVAVPPPPPQAPQINRRELMRAVRRLENESKKEPNWTVPSSSTGQGTPWICPSERHAGLRQQLREQFGRRRTIDPAPAPAPAPNPAPASEEPALPIKQAVASSSSSSDNDQIDEEFSDEQDSSDDNAALNTIIDSLQNRLNSEDAELD